MSLRFLSAFFIILYFSISTYIHGLRLLYMPITLPTLVPCWILASFNLIIFFFSTSNRKIYDCDIFKMSLVFIAYYYFHEKGFKNQKSIESIICEPLFILFSLLWKKMTNYKKITIFIFFRALLAIIGFIFPVFFFENKYNIDFKTCLNYTCEFFILSLFIKFLQIKKYRFDDDSFFFTFSFLIWTLSSFFLVFQFILGNLKKIDFFRIKFSNFYFLNFLSFLINFFGILQFDPILIAFIQMTSTSLSYVFLDIFLQKSSKWNTIFSCLIFLLGFILYYREFLNNFFIKKYDDNEMEYLRSERAPGQIIINL